MVKQLETLKNLDAKVLAAQTAAISAELKANHSDAKVIENSFYDEESPSYYSTGEGHFVD